MKLYKTEQEVKNELLALVELEFLGHNGNDGSLEAQVDENIQWAWDNWDNLEEYYVGDKPKYYTKEFAIEWIENEDFYSYVSDFEYMKDRIQVLPSGHGHYRVFTTDEHNHKYEVFTSDMQIIDAFKSDDEKESEEARNVLFEKILGKHYH